jgi:hypothetical protein
MAPDEPGEGAAITIAGGTDQGFVGRHRRRGHRWLVAWGPRKVTHIREIR